MSVGPHNQAGLEQSAVLPTGVVVRRLLAMTWKFRAGCIRMLLLQFILLVINLAGLGLAGLGIDFIHHLVNPAARPPQWPFGLIPPSEWAPMRVLVAIAAGIIVMAVTRAWLNYVYQYGMAKLLQGNVVVDVRSRVYNQLQRLSFRFFDANASGTLINRIAGDVQNVRSFVDGVFVQGVTLVLSVALYLTYMVRISPLLTAVSLATIPLMWIASSRFSRAVRDDYRENSERMDRLILKLSECVVGMRVVKGFAREQEEFAAWKVLNRAVRDQKQRIFWKFSFFTPSMENISNLNMVILLGLGGYLYTADRLTLGTGLVVFVGLLRQLAGQVNTIANITNSLQQSLTSARRVFEVLDAPVEVRNRPGAARLPAARGEVRFENVGFEYEKDKPVLGDVSFRVEPGQCIGIMGATGSGKSTLLSLIPRFYDAKAGRVLIDGIDVRDLVIDDLRRQIGLVFQESFLFSNTIEANIAFGNPGATHEMVERAARVAAAHDFIMELPEKYDTVLGESGGGLSGGQRQRLAIARAVLMNPVLLLLDDPTAAVDTHTEHEILAAMESAMQGRTTFLVTHRVSALRYADRLLVLQEGRVAQSGTHQELIRVPGPYRRAARIQVDEESHQLLNPLPGMEAPA